MKLKFILPSLLFLVTGLASAQTVTITDNTNLQPLTGVSVYSNSPKASATSDVRGLCDITAMKDADSIFFQFVGYATKIYSYGQLTSLNYKVTLTVRSFDIGEAVVSASRFEEKREDVAQPIQVLRAKDIALANQQNSADLLQYSGNVFVQKSQLGGGSPIIRGFETNKVLLVVDGVRMNNCIYRAGHLQNVLTLDNSIMDKVEIVFGPGSVAYGSDALGGVMHFYTKSPVLSDNDKMLTRVNAFMRYSTTDEEKTAHVDINLGCKKLGSLTSVTFSDFGDLRQGNNRNPFYGDWGKRPFYVEQYEGKDSAYVNSNQNIQKGSGYKQYDILQKFTLKQSTKVSHNLNLQLSNTNDVPRYDRLTQTSGGNPKYGEWYYGPAFRFMGSYALNLKSEHGFYDHAQIIAAYQNIEESRHDRRFRKNLLNNRIEKLNILTLNADFDKMIKKNEIRYGIEATYNDLNSTAHVDDIVADTSGKLDTRYPDGGSTMNSYAAYVSHSLEINKHLVLNDGLRVSYVSLYSKFVDKTFFPFPFDDVKQNNTAVTGNIGLVYMPCDGWRFTLLGSSGFRAPSVDDLSKVFESTPGDVIVPNPDLKPEHTYNLEGGISKSFNKKVTVGVTAFYTWYTDAITTQPGTFNGEDSIIYDGDLSKVTMNVNANEAYIYGGNAFLSADVTDNFSITSTLNYTYGRIKTDTIDYPLDHIPPIFGKTSLNLHFNKFNGEFYAAYSGWKSLKDYNMNGEDNFDNATPLGMPAWVTLNVKGAYQVNKYVQLQLALENILDQNYRMYACNISSSGRNFVVTLRGNF